MAIKYETATELLEHLFMEPCPVCQGSKKIPDPVASGHLVHCNQCAAGLVVNDLGTALLEWIGENLKGFAPEPHYHTIR